MAQPRGLGPGAQLGHGLSRRPVQPSLARLLVADPQLASHHPSGDVPQGRPEGRVQDGSRVAEQRGADRAGSQQSPAGAGPSVTARRGGDQVPGRGQDSGGGRLAGPAGVVGAAAFLPGAGLRGVQDLRPLRKLRRRAEGGVEQERVPDRDTHRAKRHLVPARDDVPPPTRADPVR
uniref:Uncharacterized protein n=1 Tax=Streptomyces sp. F12 TaxID=1436084 RepID=V9Z3M9_9ACTN|nr:hypothetical protein pFRL6_13 [Streptomyces sp. F12]